MRKTGIIFRDLKDIPLKENAELVRSIGFDCVFTGYKEGFAKAEKVAEAVREAGLIHESIHAPFGGINNIWLDGEAGDAALNMLMDCLEGCSRLGVPIMVVHLSSGEDAPAISDVGHARWDKLIDAAVAKNVNIAFENQRKLANIAFVMELYKNVPQVGFCWDCGHESCFTPGIEYMPLFGKRLMYTHIHDNLGSELVEPHSKVDLHYLPFDGKMNYDRFAQLIRRYEYKGTLTLETCPPSRPRYASYSIEEFYRAGYSAICRIVSMCDGN